MSEIRTISDESLAQAVEIVRDGGLIVIPTDTVYGVACDPRNIEAIRKVFAAKQRPKYKSLQVLLPSIESMEKLHLDLPVPLNRLSAMFMPGAFSPIAVADDDCTLATVRTDPATGKVTQGVRIPNSTAALRVLRATGPLAATSANRSGDESAQTVDEAVQVVGSFGSHVDRVVSVVAGVHFIALLLEEQHVGLQQFDFVVDPEYFDHTVIGFRICKINVFIIKRKNPAVYWVGSGFV